MFRRLRWVILILPLYALILVWVNSYCHYIGVNCLGERRHFRFEMDTGIATVILWTGSQERPEGWYFDHGEPFGGYRGTEWQLVQHFGSKSSDREGKALQVPMWFIAPFTTLPPLWFYLRQRKHRKIGFPVSPAVEKN